MNTENLVEVSAGSTCMRFGPRYTVVKQLAYSSRILLRWLTARETFDWYT